MEKFGIPSLDWHQLLTGGKQWEFLVEVGIRVLAVYVLVWVSSLLLRKRTVSQLSASQLAVLTTIGAATSVALLSPEWGLLPGAVVFVTGFIGLALVAWRRKPSETQTEKPRDQAVMVLEDGKLMFETMKRNQIPHEELYAVLRKQGIEHLGQLRRVYLETDGYFSVYRTPESVPGLSVLPKPERNIFPETVVPGHFACADCGNVVLSEQTPLVRCPRCAEMSWMEAVQELGKASRPAHSAFEDSRYYQKQAY